MVGPNGTVVASQAAVAGAEPGVDIREPRVGLVDAAVQAVHSGKRHHGPLSLVTCLAAARFPRGEGPRPATAAPRPRLGHALQGAGQRPVAQLLAHVAPLRPRRSARHACPGRYTVTSRAALQVCDEHRAANAHAAVAHRTGHPHGPRARHLPGRGRCADSYRAAGKYPRVAADLSRAPAVHAGDVPGDPSQPEPAWPEPARPEPAEPPPVPQPQRPPMPRPPHPEPPPWPPPRPWPEPPEPRPRPAPPPEPEPQPEPVPPEPPPEPRPRPRPLPKPEPEPEPEPGPPPPPEPLPGGAAEGTPGPLPELSRHRPRVRPHPGACSPAAAGSIASPASRQAAARDPGLAPERAG